MTRFQRLRTSRRTDPLRTLCRLTAAALFITLASCTSAPRYRPGPPRAAPPPAERQAVVRYARTFLGAPYRPGGAGPGGFDCSGLVVAVYRKFDIRLPRTSLDQSRVGSKIDRSKLQPGDLVFFKTSARPVSHVGIYIGAGRFIHASTTARQVRIDEMSNRYFRWRFVTAKRVLDR